MWRKVISFLFLLVFAIQLFSQGIYFLGYHFNKAAYIKKCENKARPNLHCNGQCLLMKRIRAMEKQEERYPEMKLLNKTDIHSSRSFFLVMEITYFDQKVLPVFFLVPSLRDYNASIFHPPGASV